MGFSFRQIAQSFRAEKVESQAHCTKTRRIGRGRRGEKKRARALLILSPVIAAQAAEVGGSAKQLALLGGDKTLLPKLVHARDGDGVLVLKTEVAAGDVEEVLGVEDGGGHSGVLRMQNLGGSAPSIRGGRLY